MNYSFTEAISFIEALSEEEQQVVRWFLCDDLYNGIFDHLVDLSKNPGLAECPLLSFSPVPATSYFPGLKKAELAELFFRCTGEKISEKMKKNGMLERVQAAGISVGEVAPSLRMASFVNQFYSAKRDAYSYLLRKFEDDYFEAPDGTPLAIPHGSVFRDGLYYFPDDEITHALDLHDCNRCAGGAAPVIVVFENLQM